MFRLVSLDDALYSPRRLGLVQEEPDNAKFLRQRRLLTSHKLVSNV